MTNATSMKDGSLSPTFPQEIIDSILDQLRNDLTTLKSSSLVSSAFAASCRRMIFYKVVIDADTFKTFPRLIQRTPEIPALVRELHITGGHDDLYSEPELPPLLKEFKAIKRLRWRAFQHYSFSGWKWMPPELQESFSALLSQPTLTHLDLSGIGIFPVSEFYSLSRELRYLWLNSMTLDTSLAQPAEESDHEEKLPPIQLDHLGLAFLQNETLDFLLSKQSPFDFTQLKSCAIVEAGPASSLLLQSCRKTLRHYGHVFWRGVGSESYTTNLQRDIAALSRLRSLTLLPVYSYTGTPTSNPMLHILDVVCRSPSCALEDVTIIIGTEYFRIPYRNLDIWQEIDLALSIPGSLKKVRFIAPVHPRSEFNLEGLKKGVRDTFPKIWRMGKTHLEIHNNNKGVGLDYWTIEFSVLSSFDRYSLYV